MRAQQLPRRARARALGGDAGERLRQQAAGAAREAGAAAEAGSSAARAARAGRRQRRAVHAAGGVVAEALHVILPAQQRGGGRRLGGGGRRRGRVRAAAPPERLGVPREQRRQRVAQRARALACVALEGRQQDHGGHVHGRLQARAELDHRLGVADLGALNHEVAAVGQPVADGVARQVCAQSAAWRASARVRERARKEREERRGCSAPMALSILVVEPRRMPFFCCRLAPGLRVRCVA